MTVEELIELLEKVDDKTKEVLIQNGDDGGDYPGAREICSTTEEFGKIVIY